MDQESAINVYTKVSIGHASCTWTNCTCTWTLPWYLTKIRGFRSCNHGYRKTVIIR